MNIGHTEELLAGAALLHNLNETGLELLNRGNVVGEDTHLTGFGGDVDLDTVSSERFISMHLQVGGVGTPKKHGTFGSGQDARLTYTPVELKMVYYRIFVSNSHNRGLVSGPIGPKSYLVREGQGKLDLVRHGLSVASALDRHAEDGGAGPEGRTSKTEGVHIVIDGSAGW